MHTSMEIWTLSINCHPGACRSEQHCFSSWLTCSLCQSKLRNASISSCCWHDIQAWQIHCQIDISMYVYNYIDINLYCVINHFAIEILRRSRPCSTTQRLLRVCAWDLLLPPLVAQTARAQGLLNLLSSRQCAYRCHMGIYIYIESNNPRLFILAWPVLQHYQCITGPENDQSKNQTITSLYMYMFMNPEDGNLHRPPKR